MIKQVLVNDAGLIARYLLSRKTKGSRWCTPFVFFIRQSKLTTFHPHYEGFRFQVIYRTMREVIRYIPNTIAKALGMTALALGSYIDYKFVVVGL